MRSTSISFSFMKATAVLQQHKDDGRTIGAAKLPTDQPGTNMALTRNFKETILARAQRDARFSEALFTEAIKPVKSRDRKCCLAFPLSRSHTLPPSRPLRPLPLAEFLDWHQDQVFKKPGRDAN